MFRVSLRWTQPHSERIVIIALAEVTEEDQRTFLALQKPEINAIGQQWVRERGCPDPCKPCRLFRRSTTHSLPAPTPTLVTAGGS